MLSTYKQLFTYFLDGIKKTYTGVVHPNVFVRLFNEWGMMRWTASNMSMAEGIELTQKQIDDLQTLLCNQEFSRIKNNTIELTDFTYKYRRLDGIMVKVNLDSINCDECNRKGLSEWIEVRIMRGDQRSAFKRSILRRPRADKVYYRQMQNRIIFDTNNTAEVVKANIDYYKYPTEMDYMSMFNKTGWSSTIYDCLNTEQLKEVLDDCVLIYIERVKEERYKTSLNEKNMNQINKI